MTKITEIEGKSAVAAWSPIQSCSDVIAIGTKDSGGIGFEDNGSALDLYDLDLSNGDEPRLLGSVKTEARFSSVCWSPETLGGKYPMGLLTGGMENGVIHVWNPKAIMKNQQSLIRTIKGHATGPVKALQFNPLNLSQLATGGSDGKVLIVNLDKEDEVFMPCESTQQNAQITAVAWNTQVSHIVASAAADGTVSVWDLKSKKSWCNLRCESAGKAVADLAWNPSEGLHLLTASADDNNPVIKLWDLRSSTSMPLTTLTGHSQGILSMAWCPHDEHLLLSCGKDNRTILWDLFTLTPIGEVPIDEVDHQTDTNSNSQEMFAAGGLASNHQRRYDVQWSPIKRGVTLTCSLDRKVQAHSILGLSSSSARPPKWMRPSSSVSFGFGGSLVSCGSTDRYIRMSTVVEEESFAKLSAEFESVLQTTNVAEYCYERATKTKVTSEAELWAFMQIIFDPNSRQQLLGMLGFDPEMIASKANAYAEDNLTNGIEKLAVDDKPAGPMTKTTEQMVKQAIMVGNFDAAVECCFRMGHAADALLLASYGGGDLWTKTQQRYFEAQVEKRNFLPLVSAVFGDGLADLVQKSDPEDWKETLAIILTYAKTEEYHVLCDALGDLLEQYGDDRHASLCFMCSMNLGKVGKYWRQQLDEVNKAKGSLDLAALHEYAVKVTIFLVAVGPTSKLCLEDAELFSKYSSKLAEQGLLVSAAKYSTPDSYEGKVLRDRLYRSKASPSCLAAMGGVAPEFPFDMTNVKMSRAEPAKTTRNTRQMRTQASTASNYSQYSQVSAMSNSYAGQSQQRSATPTPSVTQPASAGTLPDGWIELQDPSSGMMYYANQTTGETTWERPQPVAAQALPPAPQPEPQKTTPATPSRPNKLASKYGDGFVTSASHPELASQYGNVGTSNPYGGARAGIASVSTVEKPPVSGTFDPNNIPELSAELQPIKDCLIGVIDALKADPSMGGSDKRLLSESERGVAVLLKRLALGDIQPEICAKVLQMIGFITTYDFGSAQSVLTDLVSSEWRGHKDWLKGVKALLQLARKIWNR
ncbi:unnamed protein product [Cylindrotheca closterium]|uniref:WW domain-containing protein n=1 Tax=Cylindrotheca closterium TaxID=2856 RepID=A0AAD2FVR4_9STRA|nr:unnamed protein product [Cylindrotheca closterium]